MDGHELASPTSSSAAATDSERRGPAGHDLGPERSTELERLVEMALGAGDDRVRRRVSASAIASSDHATIGRPPTSTNALGPPAPRRSPEPAAAMTAVACAAPVIAAGRGLA